MNPKARHFAREYALQAMYQWQLTQMSATDIEAEFIAHQIRKKIDVDYFKELIHGVPTHHEALDHHMTSFLSRPINELDPVELAILRLSIYEFIYRLDIPYRVIINEALELAKKFGSIEGYKFVNGILDQVAKTLRTTEVARDKKKP